MNRKRKNKLTDGHDRVIIQLRAAIFKRIRNTQIKAVQTVSISLLSATFLCVFHIWFKRCCCDVVYNDVKRDSLVSSLMLHHVTENHYVKYPVHNSWRYESTVLTNRIAGKWMNIRKIKLSGNVSLRCRQNGKEGRLWSDCSFRSSLILIYTILSRPVCPKHYDHYNSFELTLLK